MENISFGLCLQYIHIYTIYDKAHEKYSNKLKINSITVTNLNFLENEYMIIRMFGAGFKKKNNIMASKKIT